MTEERCLLPPSLSPSPPPTQPLSLTHTHTLSAMSRGSHYSKNLALDEQEAVPPPVPELMAPVLN